MAGMIEIQCPRCKKIGPCSDDDLGLLEKYRKAVERGVRPPILCDECYRGGPGEPPSPMNRLVRRWGVLLAIGFVTALVIIMILLKFSRAR
jgi:hypothetical protein